jgi:hypothetical protein
MIGQLTEHEIQQECVNKGRDKGYRLTPQDIDAKIKAESYWIVPLTTTTVCALTLHNGFVVIGKSACIEPDNFDFDIGRKVAFDDARRQIWALEGYRLSSRRAIMLEELTDTELLHNL